MKNIIIKIAERFGVISEACTKGILTCYESKLVRGYCLDNSRLLKMKESSLLKEHLFIEVEKLFRF